MLTLERRPAPARPDPTRPPMARAEPRIHGPSDIGPTVALAVLTAASTVGFSRVFAGHGWIGPVVLALVSVHAVCWLMRRWRVPVVAALVIGAAVGWLFAVWTVLGPYTHYGLPGAGAWSHFVNALRQARTDINTTAAPVPVTSGFRLLAALGAALVALLGDTVAFRWRYVLLGAAPGFALFVVCCTSGPGTSRTLTVGAEIAGILIYLLAQRAPGGATPQVWFAGVRTGVSRWAAFVGVWLSVAALGAGLLVTPLMHHQDGVGALGWRSGIGAGAGGTRTVANPIVDLQTRLITLTNTPVFTVQTSVPSYWRLTSLDNFTGSTWISSGSYKAFGARLPGAASAPVGTRTIQEHFHIQQLESVWLPAAFNPIAVQGVHDVSYDAASNSLITSRQSSDGFDYTVTSYQYLSTLNPAELRAAPPVGHISAYTQLPDSISPELISKARSLTEGKTTEYDKALAIQQYLLSPPFSYNLQPLSDGSGNLAIDLFLFGTHQGYCQQFAGAYAVLARAAGLPTRLAVGFSTGVQKSGVYQVTDADAHTWPEVYFGPKYGWIPFEPTPGFSDPAAKQYAGGGSTANQRTSTTPNTLPTTSTTVSRDPHNVGKSGTPTTLRSGGGLGGRAHGSWAGWAVLSTLGGALIGWLALNVGGRRARRELRRRRSLAGGPAPGVLASWDDASEMMAWRGLRQQPNETYDEYAHRAADRMAWLSTDEELPRAVTRLALLARQAAFAPRLGAGAVDEADSLAARIRQGLFRSASLRQRLAWAFVPRPGPRL